MWKIIPYLYEVHFIKYRVIKYALTKWLVLIQIMEVTNGILYTFLGELLLNKYLSNFSRNIDWNAYSGNLLYKLAFFYS